MGLLDQVVGALGGAPAGGNSAVLETLLQFINHPQTGGLSGLVQAFQRGGLGEVVNSWVGTGQNLPITAEQIQHVFGSPALQGLAAQLGLSPDKLSGQLAELLPQVVDHLTPNGHVPESSDLLAQGLDLLKGKLFS